MFFSAGWIATRLCDDPKIAPLFRLAAIGLYGIALNGLSKGVLGGFRAFSTQTVSQAFGVISAPILIGLGCYLYGLEGAVGGFAINHAAMGLFSTLLAYRVMQRFDIGLDLAGFIKELPLLRTYWLPAMLGGAVVVPATWWLQVILKNQPDGDLLLGACAAAIQFRLAMFLRTDILLYLGPLLLFGAFCHRRITTAVALLLPPLALAAFYWLAHQIYAGAEPDAFTRRSLHARDVVLGTSVFELGLVDGLLRNGVKVLANLGWNLGWLTVVLVVAVLLRRLTHSLYDEGNVRSVAESATLASRRRWFVVVWLLPGLMFLTLMHCVQGYFLWILPPLCLGCVLIAQRFLSKRALATAHAIAIMLTVLQFVLYPWSADSAGSKRTIDAKIGYLSRRGLAQIDRRSEIHRPSDTWLLPQP